jgi:hypothetical protein
MANACVRHIKNTRSCHIPKVGDRIIHTSKYGDYSPNALIEKDEGGNVYLCIGPMIPFIGKTEGRVILVPQTKQRDNLSGILAKQPCCVV